MSSRGTFGGVVPGALLLALTTFGVAGVRAGSDPGRADR